MSRLLGGRSLAPLLFCLLIGPQCETIVGPDMACGCAPIDYHELCLVVSRSGDRGRVLTSWHSSFPCCNCAN